MLDVWEFNSEPNWEALELIQLILIQQVNPLQAGIAAAQVLLRNLCLPCPCSQLVGGNPLEHSKIHTDNFGAGPPCQLVLAGSGCEYKWLLQKAQWSQNELYIGLRQNRHH